LDDGVKNNYSSASIKAKEPNGGQLEKHTIVIFGVIVFFAAVFLPGVVRGTETLPHPDTYMPHPTDISKMKNVLDDSTDLMATRPPKSFLPPEINDLMTFDVDEAKKQTAEILGFKSPDVVNKIAPEIKPGKYNYKDLEKYPGLKDLFPPEFVMHIKPGGPPFIASIPEFEIVPTRQLYWYLRLCEITKKFIGKTKLDKEGYIVPRSWKGGFPFPQPSGKFKAQQIYYNFEKKVINYDTCYSMKAENMSFDRNLTRDDHADMMLSHIKSMGRTLFPPYGWLDEHAKDSGKFQSYSSVTLEPRALRGTVLLMHTYDDPNELHQWMIYVPSLRRIRKMNPTDTQEPAGDFIYDDLYNIWQNITPEKYPYKFEIIAEREYLMPIQYNTARAWIDSKNGYAWKDARFMRRPCYVLQMTQLDPNYVYSKRIIYIDKEIFISNFSANYDQHQQLYRSQIHPRTFMPDTGQIASYGTSSSFFDHLDVHSTFTFSLGFPAPFERKDFTIQNLIKRGK